MIKDHMFGWREYYDAYDTDDPEYVAFRLLFDLVVGYNK